MDNQFSRPVIFLSLGLAIAMVIGVIAGAKFVLTNAQHAPVVIADYPSPTASSPECQKFIAGLPEKFMGHPRAEVAEPQPDGTAAWATYSSEAVTLRCGVDLPYQFNKYSQLQNIDGAQWLEVKDMTPGSTLVTWYTTDRFPVVAVTTHEDRTPKNLDLSPLTVKPATPQPAPLSELKSADTSTCGPLMSALPEDIAPGYSAVSPSGASSGASSGANSSAGSETTEKAWSAPGREAIVVRCGVTPPPGYKAGERLQQINEVPWFEDTTVASGTTASTWFALGRSTDVAVHVPHDVADEVLVDMSTLLAKAMPEQQPATSNH